MLEIGQRWQSDTESELGLGIISSKDFRTVTIDFPASQQTRVYSSDNAPITRVVFGEGDEIQSSDHWSIVVDRVITEQGILIYEGKDANGRLKQLPETHLNHFIKFNSPKNRLLMAQLDPDHWFTVRKKSLTLNHALEKSPVRGLYGPRVSLIPHQIYIAHSVAQRASPRVLLADEVGLGKTIEAGMILHQQVLTGVAQRILVLVPETLVHQWLVEMLRRFNLRFSVFDEQRCEAIVESQSDTDTQTNPFHTEQLVLCNLSFVTSNTRWQKQLLDGQWDLLVVDEAHHLHWEENNPSAEYQLVEELAHRTASILLLTATPEQLGIASHFARLRLLDPNRFHSLKEFTEEENNYASVAKPAGALMNNEKITPALKKILKQVLKQDYSQEQVDKLSSSTKETAAVKAIRQDILSQLIDRHGTGRVLFRNTRNAISGFPKRQLHPQELHRVEAYEQCVQVVLKEPQLRQVFQKAIKSSIYQLLLCPELLYQTLLELGADYPFLQSHWTEIDPRISWVDKKLKELKNKKVLIFCANQSTVLDLSKVLSKAFRHKTCVFHESMSIVERDRTAAYFADPAEGADVLICSEIGSEGRNFQFSHHMILFDLPYIPDLLEQRIGRLDRIGQSKTINIHVPYIENSAQHSLFLWYHEGLDAFNQTCAPAQTLYEQFHEQLNKLLESTETQARKKNTDVLLKKTKTQYKNALTQLEKGRDRLLEINSHRKDLSKKLRKDISLWDEDPDLPKHLEQICHMFGVEFEDHSERTIIIKPSDHMLVHSFPELPAEGITATFDRNTALVHENMRFLTWEHPMVTGAIDLVLSGDYGTTALSVVQHPGLKTGTVLIESIFILECIAPEKLQINRFLPATPVRVLLDKQFKDYSNNAEFAHLNSVPMEMDKQTLKDVITSQKDIINNILNQAEKISNELCSGILSKTIEAANTTLSGELSRLDALKKVNPSVREEELEFLQAQKEQILESLSKSSSRLDSVRLIIAA